MKPWSLFLLCLFIAVFFVRNPVHAGQDDLRLDPLFQSLKEAQSPGQALLFESLIWKVWLLAGDQDVDREMARGVDFMNVGDLTSALRSFDKVIALDPDVAEGWNKRATVYYLLGDLKRSVLDIERVVALESRHFGAFRGLA